MNWNDLRKWTDGETWNEFLYKNEVLIEIVGALVALAILMLIVILSK